MMRKGLPFSLFAIGVLLVLLLGGCGGATESPAAPPPATKSPATAAPATATPAPTSEPQLQGDPIRGGKLYDKWWEVLGVDGPEEDHPLWAQQTTNKRSGADTWRCKECHGWDYLGKDGAYGPDSSHYTGFVGVWASREKSAAEILAALKGATNPEHDFSIVMDEQALVDLALFIRNELLDASTVIGADKKPIGGDPTNGESLFQENCADCHGPQGIAINFHPGRPEPEYIATIAQENPWEFLHKARFGQPGVPDMTSGVDVGLSTQEYADLLAFAQGQPTRAPVAEGGRMYDKWWKTVGAEEPTTDHPLWAQQTTNTRSGADTWRCKECHGWDYLGKDGAYGPDSSHYTGFVGVWASRNAKIEDLVAVLSGQPNPDHDFSNVLDGEQIEVLATFLQEGLVDMSPYIQADKTVVGDADHGQVLFNKTCKTCHGEDGRAINFGDENEPEVVGTIANDNPWEFFHKVSFGQPGEPMPAGVNLGWTPQDIADLLKYAQTLPTK